MQVPSAEFCSWTSILGVHSSEQDLYRCASDWQNIPMLHVGFK